MCHADSGALLCIRWDQLKRDITKRERDMGTNMDALKVCARLDLKDQIPEACLPCL